ncbi:glycosyltransferase family 2 protein [Aeromonas veronii]
MLVSIVIPVYNSKALLLETLRSIAEQDLIDVEVIIVDGGSTDGVESIFNDFESVITSVLSEKDSGIYDAMNKGIKLSNGEFVYFIGAGDTLVKGVLQKVKKLLLSNKGCFIYGNVLRTSTSKLYDGGFNKFKILRKNICHQAIFYPKSFFNKQEFNVKYKVLADYHMNLLAFGCNDLRKIYVNLTIAIYDDGAVGFSKVHTDTNFINDIDLIINSNSSMGFRNYYLILKVLRKLKKTFFGFLYGK